MLATCKTLAEASLPKGLRPVIGQSAANSLSSYLFETLMDIESHESAMLLKESSSRRRQGLALKLAVVLCGLGLLVNLNGPTDTNIGVTFSSNKEEKKVTAAAGVSRLRDVTHGSRAAGF